MDGIEYLDIETFIDQVKNHSEVWDFTSEDYKDKRKRETAWENIATEVMEGYGEKGEKEKRVIVKKLSSKWKNIKDTYAKSEKRKTLKKFKNRPYIYAKKLTFLTLPTRAVSQSTFDDEEDTLENDSGNTEDDSSGLPLDTSFAVSTIASPLRNVQIKREEDNPQLRIENYPYHVESPDPDQSFFDSMLPFVRNLNDEEKLEFRLEVINALKRIKRENS